MSGGPYGRGKAPERACMKRAQWPDADRRLWTAALAPTDPFSDEGGARAAHRPLSNRNVERGYGRWLTFLARRGQLSEADHPADRITPESVRDYVGELQRLDNKASTILARLEELGRWRRSSGRRGTGGSSAGLPPGSALAAGRPQANAAGWSEAINSSPLGFN